MDDEITKKDDSTITCDTLHLDAEHSAHIFNRTGEVAQITVYIDESILK